MDRNEFLAVLESALKGEIPDYEIAGHIQYYDSYIRENNGKTEDQKLAELGDPRLIARTIIDARMSREEQGNCQENYRQAQYDEGNERQESGQTNVHYRTYTWDRLTWYQKLLALLILLLVIVAVIAVAGLGIQIFFSVILPGLVVVFVIRVIISFFR